MSSEADEKTVETAPGAFAALGAQMDTLSTKDEYANMAAVSYAKHRARVQESVKVLLELLQLPCDCLNDPDPQVVAAAKRDADAISHAIAIMQGRPDEGNVWEESYAQEARNAAFYRGLVEKIGKRFGAQAYTADDGGIGDRVLALKVPELVNAQIHFTRKLIELIRRAAPLAWANNPALMDDAHQWEKEAHHLLAVAAADEESTNFGYCEECTLYNMHSPSCSKYVSPIPRNIETDPETP